MGKIKKKTQTKHKVVILLAKMRQTEQLLISFTRLALGTDETLYVT